MRAVLPMSAFCRNVFYINSKLRIIFVKRGFPIRYYAVFVPSSRENQGYVSNRVCYHVFKWYLKWVYPW